MERGSTKKLGKICLAIALCLFCSLVESSHILYEEHKSFAAPTVNPTLRTGYHFQPPRNWINDPNGPMYYKGLYHLFYQYNPNGSVWGNIVWAHSVSTDLINWKALEPAIRPSKPFDINGCWSGSATILSDGTPAILYTGIDPDNRQVQNIAYPKDPEDPYLREWVKPDFNPVIDPDSHINASAFRDPTTAWQKPDKSWYLVIGSKWDTKGLAILYKSTDKKLAKWEKVQHPLHSSNGTGMWECPDFFPVALHGEKGLNTSVTGDNVKHVFKVSLDLTRFEYYTIGKYDLAKDLYVPDKGFADDRTGLRYDYGNFYASKTFYDPVKHRRILWGWANESDSVDDDKAKGWAGIQAIPRTILLDTTGRQLVQWPVEELEQLRAKKVVITERTVGSRGLFEVKGLSQTSQVDVEVVFEISNLEKAEAFDPAYKDDAEALCGKKGADVKGGVGPFGLFVLTSAGLGERTAVFFRVFKHIQKHVVLMCIDPTRSTSRPNIYKPTFAGFVDIDIEKTKSISLRTLIDNSVVEAFGAEGRTCITSRVYPSYAIGKDAHLFVFNNGQEEIEVSELKAWEMKKPCMNEEKSTR